MTKKKYFLYAFYSVMLVLSNNLVNGMEAGNQLTHLLDNPLEKIHEGRIVKNNFISTEFSTIFEHTGNDQPATVREKFYSKIALYTALHPFFLLNECPHQNIEKSECQLSRQNIPDPKSLFESKLSIAMTQKIGANPNRTINYVGFCTKGCFSDFIVIAQTLRQHPGAQLNIHLIDECYSGYAGPKKEFCNTHEIKSNNFSDPSEFNQFIQQYMRWAMGKTADLIDPSEILKSFLPKEALFKQFLQGLQNNFPNAQVRLFAYQSWRIYLDDIAKNNLDYADVIAASDTSTENRRWYSMLCLQTLKHNPHLYNGLLDLRDDRPELVSISLEKLNDDSTPIEANGKIHGYINGEFIGSPVNIEQDESNTCINQ